MHPRFSYPILILVVVFTLAASSVASCGSSSANQDSGGPSGTVAISGAFALYPMMGRWTEEFNKLNPKVNFDVSAGGAGKGMADTLAGAGGIGMVSPRLKPEEEAP